MGVRLATTFLSRYLPLYSHTLNTFHLTQHPAFPERIALLKEEAAKVRPIYEESTSSSLFALAGGGGGAGGGGRGGGGGGWAY